MTTIAHSPHLSRGRIESVDLLRGVIMILMALDHTRDFFGRTGINPTDPAQTTVALFFTRWVTHLCAPVFFLLTGTGVYLSLRKGSITGLSRFLFTRGLWLIFLELTIFRCLGFQFNFDYRFTILTVLWALGWAMITLSALVHLPTFLVIGFGAILILSHNLLDSAQSTNPFWVILHSPNLSWKRRATQSSSRMRSFRGSALPRPVTGSDASTTGRPIAGEIFSCAPARRSLRPSSWFARLTSTAIPYIGQHEDPPFSRCCRSSTPTSIRHHFSFC